MVGAVGVTPSDEAVNVEMELSGSSGEPAFRVVVPCLSPDVAGSLAEVFTERARALFSAAVGALNAESALGRRLRRLLHRRIGRWNA